MIREYLTQQANAQFTFRYISRDGKTTELTHEIDDSSTWASTVETYLSFLEIVYGYPIKQDILYDVDIYTHDVLTADRLVYTNWKLKNKDEKDIEE